MTFDFKLFDIQKSLDFNYYYIYIIYNIYIVITFCQIFFSKSTSTLNFNFKTLKILNVKSQKSKSPPKQVRQCSRTPDNTYALYPRKHRELLRAVVAVGLGIGLRKVRLHDLDAAYSIAFPQSTPLNVNKKKRH